MSLCLLLSCEKKKQDSEAPVAREKEYLSFDVDGEIRNKWVVLYQVDEYDAKGNPVLDQYFNSYLKKWQVERYSYEYDSQGNAIKKLFEDGSIWWECKYDQYGNQIYNHDAVEQTESWKEYDSAGNLVHEKEIRDSDYKALDNYIYERWLTYDEKGNCISSCRERSPLREESNVSYYIEESKSEYDNDGRIVLTTYTSGNFAGYSYHYEYNEFGDELLFTEAVNGYITSQNQYEYEYYDDHIVKKKTTLIWDSNKKEYSSDVFYYELNEDRQIIHQQYGVVDDYFGYDSSGNMSYYRDAKGNEMWASYIYWDNGNVKKKNQYKLPEYE